MKSKTKIILGVLSMWSLSTMASQLSVGADTLISTAVTRQKVIENGGGGLYRSIVVTDKAMTGYTIYRPRDVKWAAKHEGKLPLLIWANGACGNDNSGYQNMLNDLASHGYVVIALGQMKVSDSDESGGTSGQEHIGQAIDWMVKQVTNSKSDYYKAVNVNNVALSGHSCGGAEAIANCGNSRVKTLMIMNAGMGGMSMGGASPQSLNSLHCPIIYLTGGPDDVAYSNAQTDFNTITKVPVVWADLSNAGHGGTYWHRHGGDFERIALKWMDWHLKGKTQNASVFLKPDYTDFAGWKFDNRNFKNTDYDAAYNPGLTVGDTIFNRAALDSTFAFGADISSTNYIESKGDVFYNRQGKKVDLVNVLKDDGMNAVRLRVWVNPEESFSNKADVQKLCSRAKKVKMDIMIDFHYSDFWANGGNQFKPASWEGHSAAKLEEDVYNHTFDVLNTLKKAGVKVRWAQIGNDVENGMLWGDGRLGNPNLVRFINSAYSAIKAVDAETQAVLHAASGQDLTTLETFFDQLQENGAQWDAIGLSAYPKWSGLKNNVLIQKTTESVRGLKQKYGKPVMVVEAGHYNNKPLESNNFLCDLIDSLVQVGASGVFYWEPEVVKDYELGAWNPLNRQPSIALTAFNGIKHSSVPYIMKFTWNMPQTYINQEVQPFEIPVEVAHIRPERFQKLELMSSKTVLATDTTGKANFRIEALDKGLNILYARATSSDGLTMTTDTCYFFQGPLTTLNQTNKEEANGKDYKQHWCADVKQPGEYMAIFGYQTPTVLTPRLFANGTSLTSIRFNATDGKTAYRTCTIKIDNVGKTLFTLQGSTTKLGIPAIETFMLVPLNGQEVSTVEDPTGIEVIVKEGTKDKYYDLQGRRVYKPGKGIIIKDKLKMIN